MGFQRVLSLPLLLLGLATLANGEAPPLFVTSPDRGILGDARRDGAEEAHRDLQNVARLPDFPLENKDLPAGQLNAGIVNFVGFEQLKQWSHSKGNSFSSGFIASYILILCTELGDKTFFIAALLAMKRGAWVTFLGAFAALVIMTIISALAGVALPFLVDRKYTHAASVILFAFFGGKLLWEGFLMKPSSGPSAELEEVELELNSDRKSSSSPASPINDGSSGEQLPSSTSVSARSRQHVAKQEFDVEQQEGPIVGETTEIPDIINNNVNNNLSVGVPSARRISVVIDQQGGGPSGKESCAAVVVPASPLSRALIALQNTPIVRGLRNLFRSFSLVMAFIRWQCTKAVSPSFVEAFSLTLTAEWGDRSQVATVALAASKNIFGVNLGAILGHCCCTGLAVLGGKLLASRISERAVTISGGFSFLLFACIGFVTGL